jgi:hypothetical protein
VTCNQPSSDRNEHTINFADPTARPPRTSRPNKPREISCGQAGKVKHVIAQATRDERPHAIDVAANRALGQAPLTEQPAAEVSQQLLHRPQRNLTRDRQHSKRNQVVHQRLQRLDRPIFPITSCTSLGQITVKHHPIQIA